MGACDFISEHPTGTSTHDTPQDLRDFVAKQCYISRITRPPWLGGNYIDLRATATAYFERNDPTAASEAADPTFNALPSLAKRGLASPNIPAVLEALNLAPFQGRQHSGIDDVRNIARILQEITRPRRGWRVIANATIKSRERRWRWMNRTGQVVWAHPPGPAWTPSLQSEPAPITPLVNTSAL